jgi:hypothetical protein
VLLLPLALLLSADPTVSVVLWFDTEDYITPADDEACLRLARDLTARGVEATFKIVGEKARVLEARQRRDVIDAMRKHDIAYHSDNHSIPPHPAVYLRPLGMREGAEEWLRREGPGAEDVKRIFRVKTLSTYGQPGSSWGPQAHSALRQIGIRTYVDEGRHVGLNDQPFWYGGLLYIFNLGPNSIRVDIEDESKFDEAVAHAKKQAADLASRGGGVMHFWYHPNEFVTTEFWDGVNFSRGASPAREQWQPARLRTPDAAERCHRIFNRYVDELKKIPSVRFESVRQIESRFQPQAPPVLSANEAKEKLRSGLKWNGGLSAAELVAAALGVPGRVILAPETRRSSTVPTGTVSRRQFARAAEEAKRFIERENRLPSHVWIDSEMLSIDDFAAMLGADSGGEEVRVVKGELLTQNQISGDPCRTYNWVIHPAGFCAPELLDLARLEGWTLKPVSLKQ